MTISSFSASQKLPLVVWRVMAVLFLLLVFLLGVKGLGDGFKLFGKDFLDSFFSLTANPFVGIFVGVLATTLVQSSSVSTSMIVGLVAAPENPLPLANAVPMIMGANIGTTVTCTVVSLAHMGRRDEFERAFSVAGCHDFFNILAVMIFLPLELMTGYLQSIARFLSGLVVGIGGFTYESPFKALLSFGFAPIQSLAEATFDVGWGQAMFLVGMSAALIFLALWLIVRLMRSLVSSRIETAVSSALGSNAVIAIVIGIIVTVMVQSSSITTSIMVPLAAAGVLRLEQAFPITIGANIGTTITAMGAALAVSGPNAIAGIEIALVHLFFNLSGAILIYPVRRIRQVPLQAARMLAAAAVKSRKLALFYVGTMFYGFPALLIYVTQLFK
jgi:sodium-dependent phosphate cotransporter